MGMEPHLNESGLVVSNQQISLSSSQKANSLNDSSIIKPDPDFMEYNVNKTSHGVSNQQISLSSSQKANSLNDSSFIKRDPDFKEYNVNKTIHGIVNQQISLSSSQKANSLNDSSFIKRDPDDMEYNVNKTIHGIVNQQISLPLTSRQEANSSYDFTCIKCDPSDREYNVNKTSQGVSNQQIPFPCPLKYEVKEEMMYCQFCSYSDVDFSRLKFHTFTQHPTGAAVVKFGESDQEFKFFCVKETCNFSTTICNVYEEHLMNCCPLHQTLPGKEKERLNSTFHFVVAFHNKHSLMEAAGFLEYFSSFIKTYASEDDHIDLRKLIVHNGLFSVVSKSSSLSDIQSSVICEDVGGRELEAPSSSVLNPVPVFIVQNQNATLTESRTKISENISTSIRKQSKLGSLTDHKTTPTSEKSFECDVCDKKFTRSCHVIVHRRKHTGEKPFKCTVCAKEYTNSRDLNVHIRTHTGEKPFKCSVCDKKFICSNYLTVHKRTHTGVKPHKCSVCAKEYTNSRDLNFHKRIHTGEKPYICNVCDRGFADSSNFHRHEKTHIRKNAI